MVRPMTFDDALVFRHNCQELARIYRTNPWKRREAIECLCASMEMQHGADWQQQANHAINRGTIACVAALAVAIVVAALLVRFFLS